jgi:hypothetical protein
MWKISVVMLVTAVFAGLLISSPYELSSKSAALPINMPPRPVPALAPAETVAAAETPPPPIRPQDIENIVLKVLADRIAPQERVSSGIVGAPADKPVETAALRPLPASNGFQQRPALQSAAQTPVVQPVSAKREDSPVSRMDVAPSDRPVATVALRPASNGFQERPVLQSAPQNPVVQPVLGRREDQSLSHLDVAFTVGGACANGEVIGLDPNGDNFLSVRSGPGGQPYREINRLFSADAVHVCGRKGLWLAVAYSPARKAQGSCDIVSKGARRPYEGPCQYGWVHSRYIKVAATDNLGGW